VRRALAIQESMHPLPIEACVTREALGARESARGHLAEAAALIAEPQACLERAFVPGSIILLWSRLSTLELMVRSGRGADAIEPLGVLEQDIARLLPKAGWLRAEAVAWREKAMCKSECGK